MSIVYIDAAFKTAKTLESIQIMQTRIRRRTNHFPRLPMTASTESTENRTFLDTHVSTTIKAKLTAILEVYNEFNRGWSIWRRRSCVWDTGDGALTENKIRFSQTACKCVPAFSNSSSFLGWLKARFSIVQIVTWPLVLRLQDEMFDRRLRE